MSPQPSRRPADCPYEQVVGFVGANGFALPVYAATPPAATTPAPSVSSTAEATQAESRNPHFNRIGGEAAISRLVEAFYHRMNTLPEAAGIRAMHGADLRPVKEVLARYLAEWMGGPALYSQERGHPRLRRKHLPFAIGPAERDAWMLCMRGALDEVVTDTELKQQLTSAFFKVADFIRNDKGNTHHDHHAHPARTDRQA